MHLSALLLGIALTYNLTFAMPLTHQSTENVHHETEQSNVISIDEVIEEATTVIFDEYEGLRNVSYFISNGHVVIDFDIIYGNETTFRKAEAEAQAMMASGMNLRKRGYVMRKPWPDATINYCFTNAETEGFFANIVKEAAERWTKRAPFIRFNLVSKDDSQVRPKPVQITKVADGNCRSSVGYEASTLLSMDLKPSCNVDAVTHELGHVLGMTLTLSPHPCSTSI